MLSKHPITKAMYQSGYNGIEDIYEYWLENKEVVIHMYQKNFQPANLKKDLHEFMCKIRWGGIFGLFMRMEINQHIRINPSGVLELETIKVRFGDAKLGLSDFSDWSQVGEKPKRSIDLRGISILKQHLKNVLIEDVDFTFTTFDYSTFEKVVFRNCVFEETSFQRTKLINCTFESDCIMIKNNFKKAVLDSNFKCNVIDPAFRPKASWMLNANIIRYVLKYPNFTIILNPSVVEQSNSDMFKVEYEFQSSFRNRIRKMQAKHEERLFKRRQ